MYCACSESGEMPKDDVSRASKERLPMLYTFSEVNKNQERESSNLPHTGEPRDPDASDVLCTVKNCCQTFCR